MCEAERNVCGREMKIRHEIKRSVCVYKVERDEREKSEREWKV